MTQLAELRDFAIELAIGAGRRVLEYDPIALPVDRKPDASPVTEADRAAEQWLRARIAGRFPDDGILGEESGEARPGAARRWVLDPIDGTRSFVRGVPLFGVLIGVEIEGRARVGVIHIPALGETVAAAHGLGCTWNGRPARVSPVAALGEALVLTTDVRNLERAGRRAAWQRLESRAGLARTWGDCYGYVLVATGRAECMIDPIVAAWDAAAVIPCVEEAGGVITDLDGGPPGGPGSLLATNAALANDIRSLVREPA